MLTHSLAKATSDSDLVIFDNDGVTYPITQIILDDYALSLAKAARELIPDLPLDEGVRLAWKSWFKYKYSLQIFVDEYKVDLEELHLLYHRNCDTTIIPVDNRLSSSFDFFKPRRAMLTHGGREWTYRVLDHVGVRRHFGDEQIYSLEDVDFLRKSDSTEPYERVLCKERCSAERAMMVDDAVPNLAQAKKLGMTTVLITNGKLVAPNPDVDFIIADLHQFLSLSSGPSAPSYATRIVSLPSKYSVPTL